MTNAEEVQVTEHRLHDTLQSTKSRLQNFNEKFRITASSAKRQNYGLHRRYQNIPVM